MKPNGSRFAIVMQLKKVLREAIPRIQTFEEAHKLECELYRCRSAKILNDTEYLEFSNAIRQVCVLKGWINDDKIIDQSAAAPMQHNTT